MKVSRFSDNQILAILKQAEESVPVTELCREAGHSLQGIVEMVENVAAQIHSIAAASEEQSATSNEINQ